MHISDIIFTSASLYTDFPLVSPLSFHVYSFIYPSFPFIPVSLIYVSFLLQVHRFCLPPRWFFLFRFIFLLYLFLAILVDRARASDVPIEL